ncbi:MAG TPA: zinc ribbon domain-containing protein [bacterium]|nr:zinc ribbon domain-containing protein [bacterium]
MPLFEYVCSKCHTSFEELVQPHQTDSFSPRCPACNSSSVSKKLSIIAKPTTEVSNQSASSCASGNCPLANSPCAHGMCGLN